MRSLPSRSSVGILLLFSQADLPSLTDLFVHFNGLFGLYDWSVTLYGESDLSSYCSLKMIDLPSLHHLHGEGGLQFFNCLAVRLKSVCRLGG